MQKIVHDNLELISLHIPKTAGTSFRNILKQAYGKRKVGRFDISPKGIVRLNEKLLTNHKLPKKLRVIHGHFKYLDFLDKTNIGHDIPVVTWVRNPVDRLLSNYHFLEERLLNLIYFNKEKGKKILTRVKKSLVEFARDERNRNRMSKFLNGKQLEDFYFVGIMEHFQEDVETLARKLDWNKIQVVHLNWVSREEQLDEATIENIIELNQDDYDLYLKALSLRNKQKDG